MGDYQLQTYLEALTISVPVGVSASGALEEKRRMVMESTPEVDQCGVMRFMLLRLVGGYEHYIALNLPLAELMEKPFEKILRFPKEL